ncbi:MAG TPA: OsmC family protein [Jatrophihabitans sp.]|uniref:OsmC family protein n=1 Tax=Jatrophihabitans sp. TaxID=1932789 RepID=UPI002E0876A6|nr:OsmC family protein [Jatrophihabitans sp.]
MNHQFTTQTVWTGNTGSGTSTYRAYERSHEVTSGSKAAIAGSSAPAFRGDAARWNPEELVTAALANCHMLAFLHLAADAGVVVVAYRDEASGSMTQTPGGGGHMTEVVLRPEVTVRDAESVDHCAALHDKAHELCFVAASVAFPVRHEATVRVRG